MALKIVAKPSNAKLKPKSKSVAVPDMPYAVLVDQLVDIETKWQLLGIHEEAKRVKDLKEELQLIAKDAPPKEPVVFYGTKGNFELSPCANSRRFKDAEAIINHLAEKFGDEATLACLTVKLGEVEKLLSANELAQFTEDCHGPRKGKIVKIV